MSSGQTRRSAPAQARAPVSLRTRRTQHRTAALPTSVLKAKAALQKVPPRSFASFAPREFVEITRQMKPAPALRSRRDAPSPQKAVSAVHAEASSAAGSATVPAVRSAEARRSRTRGSPPHRARGKELLGTALTLSVDVDGANGRGTPVNVRSREEVSPVGSFGPRKRELLLHQRRNVVVLSPKGSAASKKAHSNGAERNPAVLLRGDDFTGEMELLLSPKGPAEREEEVPAWLVRTAKRTAAVERARRGALEVADSAAHAAAVASIAAARALRDRRSDVDMPGMLREAALSLSAASAGGTSRPSAADALATLSARSRSSRAPSPAVDGVRSAGDGSTRRHVPSSPVARSPDAASPRAWTPGQPVEVGGWSP